jgi:thiamine biosynthesis protein ThiC
MSHDYSTAWDALTDAIGAAKGQTAGSITDQEHLTLDQRLKVAEVAALLSIAQELSALNPQNTSSRDEEGNTVNGWGVVIKKAKPKPGKLTVS